MFKYNFSLLIGFLFISQTVLSQNNSVILNEGLVVKLPESVSIMSPDPVAGPVLLGNWKTPREGEKIYPGDGNIGLWKKVHTGEKGWINDDSLTNAYVYFSYQSDKEKVMILEAMGNNLVYINGSPRSGNPYRYKDTYESWEPRFDYSLLPVKINKGSNDLIFHCSRGVLKAKLNDTEEGLLLNKEDLTVPDLIVSKLSDTYGAIPIINTTEKNFNNLFIKTWTENSEPAYYKIADLLPLSVYKTPFFIKIPGHDSTGKIQLNIQLIERNQNGEIVHSSLTAGVNIVNENETRRETFISHMDGSVQYYAVNPPVKIKRKPALFLSLHGAGVEAINQALSYGHKYWGYIIAPTNRRPYGFNWENWGRLDALEVLDIARNKFSIDEDRIYLTGHSMGGHGTWQLGVNYPDKFAAVGPSAGWISIWSYRIKPIPDTTRIAGMLLRSTKQSDTYSFAKNLKPDGIYIIHGSADDNVPPEQSASMINVLKNFHKDYIYHEEPGAGHWWDNSDEPGADCVDWPPMFDFFAHHSCASNAMIKEIDYTTSNLAVSSENYWIKIINQEKQQKLSTIKISLEEGKRKFTGTTQNIQFLQIDASMLPGEDTITVQLDSQSVSIINRDKEHKIYLKKINDMWSVSDKFSFTNKYPGRCGNFREVLNNDIIFVYGTKGSQEENTWAFEKAKYDAERMWYQGNASIEVIKDADYNETDYKDRNVLLYGNSSTNAAWNTLLSNPGISIEENELKIGDKVFKGKDIACLMIYPKKNSETASVGVISGTGITGMKLTGSEFYFHPYTNLPDIVIYNKGILSSDEEGVLFAGYFGNDWSLGKGEFVEK